MWLLGGKAEKRLCNGASLDECPWRAATRGRILRQGEMQPSIRERLGLVAAPYPTAESRSDAAVMARSMMYLFAAGAGGAVSAAFGSPPRARAAPACRHGARAPARI